MDGLVERIQTMIAERLRPIRHLAPARFFLGACAINFLGVVAIALAPTVLPIGVLTVLMITLAVTFRPQGELAFVKTGLACV